MFSMCVFGANIIVRLLRSVTRVACQNLGFESGGSLNKKYLVSSVSDEQQQCLETAVD